MEYKITDNRIKEVREQLVELGKKLDIDDAKVIKQIIQDWDQLIMRLALAETDQAVHISKAMNLHPLN